MRQFITTHFELSVFTVLILLVLHLICEGPAAQHMYNARPSPAHRAPNGQNMDIQRITPGRFIYLSLRPVKASTPASALMHAPASPYFPLFCTLIWWRCKSWHHFSLEIHGGCVFLSTAVFRKINFECLHFSCPVIILSFLGFTLLDGVIPRCHSCLFRSSLLDFQSV